MNGNHHSTNPIPPSAISVVDVELISSNNTSKDSNASMSIDGGISKSKSVTTNLYRNSPITDFIESDLCQRVIIESDLCQRVTLDKPASLKDFISPKITINNNIVKKPYSSLTSKTSLVTSTTSLNSSVMTTVPKVQPNGHSLSSDTVVTTPMKFDTRNRMVSEQKQINTNFMKFKSLNKTPPTLIIPKVQPDKTNNSALGTSNCVVPAMSIDKKLLPPAGKLTVSNSTKNINTIVPASSPSTSRTLYFINQPKSSVLGDSTMLAINHKQTQKIINFQLPTQYPAQSNQIVKLVPISVNKTTPTENLSIGKQKQVLMINLPNQNQNQQPIYLSLNPLNNTMNKVNVAVNNNTSKINLITSKISVPNNSNPLLVGENIQQPKANIIHNFVATNIITPVNNNAVSPSLPCSTFSPIPSSTIVKPLTGSNSKPLNNNNINTNETIISKVISNTQLYSARKNVSHIKVSSSGDTEQLSNDSVSQTLDKLKPVKVTTLAVETTARQFKRKPGPWSYERCSLASKVKITQRASECARANGLKPYKRKTPLFISSENIVSATSNSNDLPVISEYMSLAKPIVVGAYNNVIQVAGVKSISNSAVNQNSSKKIYDKVISEMHPKEVIDLTTIEDNRQTIDKVGIIRRDFKEVINERSAVSTIQSSKVLSVVNSKISLGPTESSSVVSTENSSFVSTKSLSTGPTECLSSDSARNSSSSPIVSSTTIISSKVAPIEKSKALIKESFIVSDVENERGSNNVTYSYEPENSSRNITKKYTVSINDKNIAKNYMELSKNDDKESVFFEFSKVLKKDTALRNDNLNDLKVDIRRSSRARPKSFDDDYEISYKRPRPNILEVSNKSSSNSFDQISRTSLALDRMMNTRKTWLASSFTARKCICTLRDLYGVLLLERQKQKLFLIDMLKKLKEKETKAEIPIKKTYISPAERLMEKFSMKKCLQKVAQQNKEHSELSKKVIQQKPIHIPPKKPTQDPPRKKTFKEILEEQRKRKLEKQKETPTSSKDNKRSTRIEPVRLVTPIIDTVKITGPKIDRAKPITPITTNFRKIKLEEILSPKYDIDNKQLLKSPAVASTSRSNKLISEPNTTVTPRQQVCLKSKKIIPIKQVSPKLIPPVVIKQEDISDEKVELKQTKSNEKKVNETKVNETKVKEKNTRSQIKSKTTSETQQTLVQSTRRRSSIVRYNPKDPFQSAEERALKQAIALSLKTISTDKKKSDQIKYEITSPPSETESTDSTRKKRSTEIDQLVDTHWNESGIKADIRSPTEVCIRGGETREQRKLHYAIARIAEMEYKKKQLKASLQPSRKRARTLVNRKDNLVESNIKKKALPSSVSKASSNVKKVADKAKAKYALTDSKRKRNCSSKTISANSGDTLKNIVKDTPPNDVTNVPTKPPPSNTLTKPLLNHPLNSASHTKEYMLVPMYKGFKDFTPIVVDSKTRRQTTLSERDKLKRQDFPLMVVEKIGDKTKHVIIKDGENKEQKLKEISNQSTRSERRITAKQKNLTVTRNTGETILHKSARLGYAEVAESKIKEGAKVDARDNAGWTALHEACAYGHRNVTEILLKYGADPNCVSNSGVRPIHDACEKGFIHILRLLLSYGADHTIATYSGYLPSNCYDEKIRTFLKEYSAYQLADSTIAKKSWCFGGSCNILDTVDCSDIFRDIPECLPPVKAMEFEISSRELLNTYYLPYIDENGLVKGYRNYHILNEVLERLSCSRNAFFLHHPKVDIRKMPWSEFEKIANQSALTLPPPTPPCSSKRKEPEIELLHIGHYTARKIFNSKTKKIDQV